MDSGSLPLANDVRHPPIRSGYGVHYQVFGGPSFAHNDGLSGKIDAHNSTYSRRLIVTGSKEHAKKKPRMELIG